MCHLKSSALRYSDTTLEGCQSCQRQIFADGTCTHQFKLVDDDLGDGKLGPVDRHAPPRCLSDKEDTLVLHPWSSDGPGPLSNSSARGAEPGQELLSINTYLLLKNRTRTLVSPNHVRLYRFQYNFNPQKQAG